MLALAGRRVDAAHAKVRRFPLECAEKVRARLCELMAALAARALVCSAAAGTDLLALDAARELGLRARVVLPFDRVRFRAASVADRPGDFGHLYDHLLDMAAARGDLVTLAGAAGSEAAYGAAGDAILDEAARLAAPDVPVAVVAWDGCSRGAGDHTAAFANAARRRGWTLVEVPTRPAAPAAGRT
ncbi:MAG TPA: hypothetical protein VFO85_13300, partial [Vicinamibacteria bacterium]|nr:hypothetical protein [Vicinamibacteria bacterium]